MKCLILLTLLLAACSNPTSPDTVEDTTICNEYIEVFILSENFSGEGTKYTSYKTNNDCIKALESSDSEIVSCYPIVDNVGCK